MAQAYAVFAVFGEEIGNVVLFAPCLHGFEFAVVSRQYGDAAVLDVGKGLQAADFGGNLTRALQDVQARFFVASFSSDWRFSPERSKELVKALIAAAKPVQYIEVKSFHGHDAFLMEDEAYIRAVRTYMNNVHRELQP